MLQVLKICGKLAIGIKEICERRFAGLYQANCFCYIDPWIYFEIPEELIMAGPVSKNAHREGERVMLSRWGGAIKMKSVFENGKLRHFAYCEKTGNTARKAKDLM